MSNADQKEGENLARRMRPIVEGYLQTAEHAPDFLAGLFGGLTGIAMACVGKPVAMAIAQGAVMASMDLTKPQ